VGAAGGALISAASRADYAAACITALTQNSHASFVVRIEEGTARGDVYTDSHDLACLI
jgi:hypothetical protein